MRMATTGLGNMARRMPSEKLNSTAAAMVVCITCHDEKGYSYPLPDRLKAFALRF